MVLGRRSKDPRDVQQDPDPLFGFKKDYDLRGGMPKKSMFFGFLVYGWFLVYGYIVYGVWYRIGGI